MLQRSKSVFDLLQHIRTWLEEPHLRFRTALSVVKLLPVRRHGKVEIGIFRFRATIASCYYELQLDFDGGLKKL